MSEKAQSRALAISEIVTSILHHMDTRTLLAAQRISRTWNDLIRNTQSLQEALFLRAMAVTSALESTTHYWQRHFRHYSDQKMGGTMLKDNLFA